jgi:hypothetical protein
MMASGVWTVALLSGCGSSIQIDPKPITELSSPLADPPAGLSVGCERPVPVPDAPLSAGAVERLWAADRVSLAACGAGKAALSGFYRGRDAGLAGK